MIDFIIDDVPGEVQELIEKENFEVQKAIWNDKFSNSECSNRKTAQFNDANNDLI